MASKGTILLVDNDVAILRVLDRSVADAGYAVVSTSDPSHALELLEDPRQVVDLLITDVFMPLMTGPELARRSLRSRPDLRILFMSGDPKGKSAFRKGDRLIAKPFAVSELLRTIREVLDESLPGIARRPKADQAQWPSLERRKRRSRPAGKS